jgi:PAS domain S-box-containing protein
MSAFVPPVLDFELLFSLLPTPHSILTPEGTILGLNAALKALLPTEAALIGQPLAALHAAAEATDTVLPTAEKWALALAATGGSTQVIMPTLRPDDALAGRYWQATLQPITQQNGQLMLVQLLDVTVQLLSQQAAEKAAARAQRERERFHFLAESLPQLIWATDAQGRAEYTNARFIAYTGHDVLLMTETDKQTLWQNIIHPDDLAGMYARWGEALGSGQAFEIEFRMRGVTGEYRWFLSQVVAQRQLDGQLQRWVGLCTDVDARHRAQEQVADQQRHMQRILDQLPLTISTMEGPDLAFTFLSAKARESMGPRAEIGRTVADSLPEIVAQGYLSKLRQVMKTRQPVWGHEERTTLTDPVSGELCEFYNNFGYLPLVGENDVATGVLAYGLNVTEQVQARQRSQALQAEAQAADRRLRYVTESLPSITFIIDQERHVLYVSPQWYAYTGVDPADDLLHSWMACLHPDDAARVADEYAAALATGAPWRYEVRLRRHDGEYRWFMSQGVPEPLEDAVAANRLRQWFCADIDIHDLHTTQQRLEAKDRKLSQILRQTPALIATLDGPEHRFTFTNPGYDALVDHRAHLGQPVAECLPELREQGFIALLDRVYRTGETFVGAEKLVEFANPTGSGKRRVYLDFTYQALRDNQGAVTGILAFILDVTNRVLARQETELLTAEISRRDEQLAHSRADFAALADNIAQLAWMADAQGNIFWYNRQWHEYTGLGPAEMQQAGWQSVHDPAFIEGVDQRYQASIRSGKPWQDTFPLRRHDGQYCWFLGQARPIRDAETGAVVRWFGTNTDVTELRQLQERLSESEEEQRIQAESIPQQVWTAEPNGTVDFYNHRTTAYLGVAMNKNGAAHWLSFVHPDDRAAMQERWDHAIATQRYFEAEFRLRRYDGQYRWFLGQAQARRAPGDRILKWYGTNTDIQQQRVLQEQVLASQKRFQQLLETLPQMAWTSRPDGGMSYYNQRWYDYTGSTLAETRDWGWEHFLHPDDLPTTLRLWRHSIATGEPFEAEHRWRNSQGQYRWFLARGEVIRDKDGEVTVWVGANTDIHEFKQVQKQLEDRNARLMRTNEDLDNFIYTASHDLKQPISNMAGIFEELTRTAYFRDPDAVKLIDYFERALNRIFATIDDLSAIVQVQRQQQEVPIDLVDLTPLVAEVIASLQDQVSQSGAVFELDFTTCPVVPFVRANLQSVLFNLISNSLKYAAPDRPPVIRLSSTLDLITGRPTLTVQDNGLGIDLDRFGPQLFQLFRRFHSHVDGTGMGLYLVNRIVQNHGGRLEVSSTVDEGTKFVLYL